MTRFQIIWKSLGYFWVMCVVYLSLTPSFPFDSHQFFLEDKLEHLMAYGFLMWWFGQVYATPVHPRLATQLVAMGILLEGIQYLTSYRTFEVGDVLANALGVLAGWLILFSGMKNFVINYRNLP